MKRQIIQKVFGFFSKLIIKKYRPKIIAVTGSVGKTSAKEAIFLVFSRYFRVRRTEKNLNTEIGLPLAFIGGVEAKNSIFLWLVNFFRALKLLILKDKKYPEFVIVEMGADKPGDIKRLVSIAKPNLSVVSAIGRVPVHVENYGGGIEELLKEKAEIITPLGKRDFAILNFDDERVWSMKDKTKAKILSFGFNEGADLRIKDYQVKTKIVEGGFELPDGIFFRIEYKGSTVPVWLKDSLGRPSAYAMAIAFACGIAYNLNIVKLGNAVSEFHQEKGRMRLFEGIKNSMILDDTYNAAPLAMSAALATFQELPAKRKIAVLGDMLELGSYALEVHEEIGETAVSFCDFVFFSGERMKYSNEVLKKNEKFKDRVFWFEPPKQSLSEFAEKLKNFIEPGDLILVKGSQGMRMELMVEEIMAHPEKAKELLVRQDHPWK